MSSRSAMVMRGGRGEVTSRSWRRRPISERWASSSEGVGMRRVGGGVSRQGELTANLRKLPRIFRGCGWEIWDSDMSRFCLLFERLGI